ncbi:hypothetical protein H632_c5460p0, partial [Helicosporidium sp. ATCC 50920]
AARRAERPPPPPAPVGAGPELLARPGPRLSALPQRLSLAGASPSLRQRLGHPGDSGSSVGPPSALALGPVRLPARGLALAAAPAAHPARAARGLVRGSHRRRHSSPRLPRGLGRAGPVGLSTGRRGRAGA